MPDADVIRNVFSRDDTEGGVEMENASIQITMDEIEDDNSKSTTQSSELESVKRRSVESDIVSEDTSEYDTKEEKVNPIRYKYEASLKVEANFRIPYNLGDITQEYESRGMFVIVINCHHDIIGLLVFSFST